MIFNQSLFFIMFVFLLASCSDSKDTNVKSNPQKVPTQIGTFFDRKIDPNESEFVDSIFEIKSEMMGTQGIAIYLGEHGGHKLFMTNKHVIDQQSDDCDSWVSLVDAKNRMFLGCKGFIYSFENLDVTILAMDNISNYSSSIANPVAKDLKAEPLSITSNTDFELQAIRLKSSPLVDTTSSLVLRTIDHDFNAIVADQSADCTALDTLSQFITDPDADSSEAITTWSLPIGCDAKPGDSGAPIFDSEGLLVGLLWGGKLNKSFVASDVLQNQISLKSSQLWTDYNFMVPVTNITSELDLVLQSGDLSQDVQTSLLSLLQSIKQ